MSTRLRTSNEFIETDEQCDARKRVCAWAFRNHIEKPAEPVKSTTPGPLDAQELPVKPRPSSREPRYLGQCYTINSNGKKSHHKPGDHTPKPPHKCLGCPTMVEARRKRCVSCSAVQRRTQRRGAAA